MWSWSVAPCVTVQEQSSAAWDLALAPAPPPAVEITAKSYSWLCAAYTQSRIFCGCYFEFTDAVLPVLFYQLIPWAGIQLPEFQHLEEV